MNLFDPLEIICEFGQLLTLNSSMDILQTHIRGSAHSVSQWYLDLASHHDRSLSQLIQTFMICKAAQLRLTDAPGPFCYRSGCHFKETPSSF